MNAHSRLQKLTRYPEWHKKSLMLNCAEMADPYSVLQKFFHRYNLINIRIALKQWLEDALDNDTEVASHVYTHENVEKLIEAAWLIFEQQKHAEADAGFDKKLEGEGREDGNQLENEDEQERRRFIKLVPLPASLKANPIAFMKRVFEIMDLEQLGETIEQWQRIALTTEGGNYDDAGERADLLDFCDGLYSIVETTYILQREMEWEVTGGVRFEIASNLKYDLLKEEQTFRLSDEEIDEPHSVIKAFYEVFTPAYARRELWDMLDSAIVFKQEGFDKINLLLQYECLHALLEAAWLLHTQPKGETKEDKTEN